MGDLRKYAEFVLQNVDRVRGRKVLIIGDGGLDEYVMGRARRISPEAPVPIVEVENVETRLGLSFNVAQNVKALGGEPLLLSVVGSDASAEELKGLAKAQGVSPEHLVVDAARPTTRKLRVMVQNHHIVRVDYERVQYISAPVEQQILARAKGLVADACAVIVQDYAKGVITESLVRAVVEVAHAAGKKVLVDPNPKTPVGYYRGCDVMTPNYNESLALSGIAVNELRPASDLLNQIGRKLMAQVSAPQMVITLSEKGMRLFEGDRFFDMPTFAQQVADVTGAGDTVVAALALGWGAGFSLEQACALSNLAAGVVVGKVGCVPCPVDELKAFAQRKIGS